MGAILLIIILGIVVVVHEAGHFLFAKKFGVRVDEFGVGFPPRAKTLFKKGETKYTLNWIPFGGFVKIFGENPDDVAKDSPDYKRSMIAKPRWQQALILFAGVGFNFILAWILFSFGFMGGLPTSIDQSLMSGKIEDANVVIISVRKDSPASTAGLLPEDKIIAIDNKNVTSVVETQEYIQSHPNQKIIFTVDEKGTTKDLEVTPMVSDSGKGVIGIGLDYFGTVQFPFFSAFGHGFVYTAKLAWAYISYFAHYIGGFFGSGTSSVEDLTGPVGIAAYAGSAAKLGIMYLISFMAIISINLAVLNLIPFPALDGGRLLFLLIEKIRGKRLSTKVVGYANLVGFVLLILLMLVVTYHDILKL